MSKDTNNTNPEKNKNGQYQCLLSTTSDLGWEMERKLLSFTVDRNKNCIAFLAGSMEIGTESPKYTKSLNIF